VKKKQNTHLRDNADLVGLLVVNEVIDSCAVIFVTSFEIVFVLFASCSLLLVFMPTFLVDMTTGYLSVSFQIVFNRAKISVQSNGGLVQKIRSNTFNEIK
jgi:hypothetical protein